MTLAVGLDAPAFSPQTACWVCGGSVLLRFHQIRLDFREYGRQDPALAEYSDRRVWIVECRSCGFGQPEELPRLPRFFERMYDQRFATSSCFLKSIRPKRLETSPRLASVVLAATDILMARPSLLRSSER